MNSDDNIDLADLERELARLSPRRPSEHLEERIAQDLGNAPAGRDSRRRARLLPFALGIGACAACVAFLLLPSVTPPTPAGGAAVASSVPVPASFTPVSARTRLVRENYGQPEAFNGIYARRVSREYEDTLVWRDPRSSTLVRWTVPREEAAVEQLTSL